MWCQGKSDLLVKVPHNHMLVCREQLVYIHRMAIESLDRERYQKWIAQVPLAGRAKVCFHCC